MARILIVDDEETLRRTLGEMLSDEGYEAEGAEDGMQALKMVESGKYDCLICDIRMPKLDGLEFLRRFRLKYSRVPVLLMTAFANVETAAEAVRYGATDYLIKPVDFDDLLLRLEEIFQSHQPETPALLEAPQGFCGMVGNSGPMRSLYEIIRQVGPSDATVLIQGESGTGKELVARAIHACSRRKDGPFIPFNCCCGPSELIDSELFGHVKGAFTGAIQEKLGLFRAASGGTLFLDEISGLSLSTQGKMLRTIELMEVMPVGSSAVQSIDTRVVVATNRDLREMIDVREFREDLYYRLRVVPINVVALRQRRDDIPLLIAYFVEFFASRLNRPLPRVDPKVVELMQNYRWPGNVRELKNVIERTLVTSSSHDNSLRVEDLPHEMMFESIPEEGPANLKEATRQFEKFYVEAAIRRAEGDKALAAKRLGIGLSSLYRKVEEQEEESDGS